MIGKPHLVENRAGTSPPGYEAGQLQVLFRDNVTEPAFVGTNRKIAAPFLAVEVELLESGLMPPQEILRIANMQGVFGGDGIYHGGAAWAGEKGQPVSQPVKGVADAPAGKTIDRHGVPS
jgi:hypothetical protein